MGKFFIACHLQYVKVVEIAGLISVELCGKILGSTCSLAAAAYWMAP